MRTQLLICCLIAILTSCTSGNRQPVVYNLGEVQRSTCDGNPLHKYHFCQSGSDKDSLILILAIDAHGDGNMAVNKIKNACDMVPALIVGSDLIKNGFPDFEKAIDELIEDVRIKHPKIGDKVILIGFSGGGRMSYSYGLSKPVYGIMTLGAGPGKVFPTCKYYGIVGLEDFNFIELYQRPEIRQFSQREHQIDFFNGGHVWPASKEIRDGLLFLCKEIDANTEWACRLRAEQLVGNLDSLAGNPMLAWKSLEKAYRLAPGNDREAIMDRAKELQREKVFRSSIQKRENFLKQENDLRFQYMNMSMSADLKSWKKEIERINEQIAFSSDILAIEHGKRLKALLGILFYSRLQSLSAEGGNQELVKVLLDAFAILEPVNSDMFFFKSRYFERQSEPDSARYYLELARQHGHQ